MHNIFRFHNLSNCKVIKIISKAYSCDFEKFVYDTYSRRITSWPAWLSSSGDLSLWYLEYAQDNVLYIVIRPLQCCKSMKLFFVDLSGKFQEVDYLLFDEDSRYCSFYELLNDHTIIIDTTDNRSAESVNFSGRRYNPTRVVSMPLDHYPETFPKFFGATTTNFYDSIKQIAKTVFQ